MDPLRQSFAIAIVFALLWLLLRWMKQRGYATLETRVKRSGHAPELEVVEKLVLTPQHSVQLLRFREELLLIGLHATGLVLLSERPVTDLVSRESLPK